MKPRLGSVLRGRRCRDCAPQGLNYHAPSVLYAIQNDVILKVGITNLSSEPRRMEKHRGQGLSDLLGRRILPTGHDALALERQWLKYVKSVPHYAVGRDLLEDGYTEAVLIHDQALAVARELLSQPIPEQPH